MKKKILEFYNQYKLYLFPIVTTLCSLILIVFIFNQILVWLKGTQAQASLVNRFKILDAKAEELKDLDETDLSSKLRLALSVFPEDKDFVGIIGFLQEIAYKNGFTIVSLQVGQDRNEQGYQGFNVRVEISGKKALLGDLLKSIESAPRLMRVSSLDINITSADNINGMLTVNVLYAPLPKTVGALDAPLPALSAQDWQVLTTLAQKVSLPQISEPSQPVSLSPRGKEDPFE